MKGIVPILGCDNPHKAAEGVEDELWRPDRSGPFPFREGTRKNIMFSKRAFFKE
jgi:hypothetical protein